MSECDSNRKQSEVTIVGEGPRGMPSCSSPTLPGLSSGSSSSSISSVDTTASPGYRGAGLGFGTGVLGLAFGGGHDDHVNALAPVITSIANPASSASAPAASRASSSSWGPAAPSASSAAADGSMPEPTRGDRIYACLFHMLDCHDCFDEVAQWRTHVLSHFRTHAPPRTARCPLCPDTKFVDGGDDDESNPSSSPAAADTSETDQKSRPATPVPASPAPASRPDHASAWNRMLDHVATDHFRHGHTLAGSRPDFELMRYLYGLRLISDAQFKAMQLAPAPSSPAYHRSQDGVRASIGSSDEPYCAPYSRRREERMRGQQRGVSVV
ncbi:uncharacterized protein N7459_009000 [Penicillium hispanicum]|uniref:uncharacterized protein n=1 Tax=Penicillium hispanicum TaxID=1080232 RepID=UPI00254137E4|nr:uncharacterized protein N7459_009000 [Penicillium hispanicum]KAJ5569570.1 hypothetical protein N7459_009000 [Penicillium hispanicum]